ncbi:DNA sulfur modification protein DndD [Bacillus sp. EB01]|uniref:DNA sulfur modification protein DndD n=1 Tax=Bacillus sp. EB01 TaxID=1347086 RepID=UPI0005C4E157|nr:DNA sulfur modification protein DndD [Bacillus sp. EB01]
MIINEIQLTNIGPYRGNNSIDFRPNEKQNVILIGGENGSGKTTLLNAIKLGLFGSYAYGFKNDNTEYFKRVQSILNMDAKRIGENNFRIKLDFSIVENFEKTSYTLFRYWKYNSSKNLKEFFEVISNGKHLSDYDKELFNSRLREIMPPQLLDLCLFDGEEISRIVSEDLLSDYLKKLSKVVFNLDLFETLENDLEVYSSQSLDVKKMETSEKELFELNQREREQKNILLSLKRKLDTFSIKKQEIEDEFLVIKNDFESYGGLVKKERDELLTKINKIENTRKQNMDKVKEFISNLLPFFLGKKLLNETKDQIHAEEALLIFKQLDSKLTDTKLEQVLISISGATDQISKSKLKAHMLDLVKPENEIIQIHGASPAESSHVGNIISMLTNESYTKILGLIEENKVLLLELQELRTKIKINDSTTEFSEMLIKLESHQKTLSELNIQIQNLKAEIETANQQLNDTLTAIEKIHSLLKESEKTKSSFFESQKIIAFSRRFREVQLKKKLQQVQIEATSMLKRIFRKHNYVSTILIDSDTYNVILLDSQKEHIEKTTLSAGEKEILLISLIWAIFKCSGRKVPFIFDTLLGRLDKTHKAGVLKEFIPNSGRQAIILSTDTEIDEQHYNLLKEHIAKEYVLNFNVERKETFIMDRYFPFQRMEANL